VEEGKEDKIKQFGAGENAADPLKSAEVPLEFIALPVKRTHFHGVCLFDLGGTAEIIPWSSKSCLVSLP
jgi:hypothetical protein